MCKPVYFSFICLVISLIVEAQNSWDKEKLTLTVGESGQATCTLYDVTLFDIVRLVRRKDETIDTIANNNLVEQAFADSYSVIYGRDSQRAAVSITILYREAEYWDSGEIGCFNPGATDADTVWLEVTVQGPPEVTSENSWDRDEMVLVRGHGGQATCTVDGVGIFDVVRLVKKIGDNKVTIADNRHVESAFSDSYSVLYHRETEEGSASIKLIFSDVGDDDAGDVGCYKLGQEEAAIDWLRVNVQGDDNESEHISGQNSWDRPVLSLSPGGEGHAICTVRGVGMFDIVRIAKISGETMDVISNNNYVTDEFMSRYSVDATTSQGQGGRVVDITLTVEDARDTDTGEIGCFGLGSVEEDPAWLKVDIQN